MEKNTIEPDTAIYNNVISVCTKANDWRLAIDVLLSMQNKGVVRDKITFSRY